MSQLASAENQAIFPMQNESCSPENCLLAAIFLLGHLFQLVNR